jgi:hypothetical protein
MNVASLKDKALTVAVPWLFRRWSNHVHLYVLRCFILLNGHILASGAIPPLNRSLNMLAQERKISAETLPVDHDIRVCTTE